ncbi:MAG: histidine kinase [Saprospiraceae bacterium]|nr:histidine kinase [Saprospiraceae bacterium]
MTAVLPELKNQFKKWSKRDSFYHIVFWLSLFLVSLVASIPQMGLALAFLTDVVNVGFFAIIAYFNFYYLFPKYLKDRNLWWHFAALVLASLLLTPIKTLFFFWVSTGYHQTQYLYISNQMFIFLSTFFVGTSTTIYQVMNDWLVQQRDKKDLESQNLQSELKFLKSQINPHFLFNTLNSLYALTLKKSDQAPEIVLKLSEMMRYMLYECNEKEVPLSKEINYLKNYLELEKLRHGNKMLIDLKINGKIKDQKIAPLMLIPFIENSFKHGINNQISQGFVNLELNVMNQDLHMALENSKSPSLPKMNGKRSGGIGLVNVKRRMTILYPEKHHLDISESPNTYKIELSLSLSN